jgi:hypothetical protein
MIADFPSPILLRRSGVPAGLGGPMTLRNRVSMPIYSPKRGFKAPLFRKTHHERAGSAPEARPASP